MIDQLLEWRGEENGDLGEGLESPEPDDMDPMGG